MARDVRETYAEAVGAELELAAEELRAADLLVLSGFHRVALSRSYFAAFRAARARLCAEGLEPRSPAGVHHLWNVHLVTPGRYEASTSKLLARLQKFREEADYARAFVVDEAGAREEIEAARGLVERIRRELG